MKRTLISVACITFVAACALPASAQTAAKSSSMQASAAPVSGIDLKQLDPAVRIQDDFNGHINGLWAKATEIPAEKSRWGAFDELNESASERLHLLIEGTVKTPGAAGSETHKIADFYSSYLDLKRRDALGLAPLKGELAQIAAIQDKHALPALFAKMQRIGVLAPFGVGVGADAKDATQVIFEARQSGLGMPDREYYLKDDEPRMKDVRAKYLAHISKVLGMNGDQDAAAHALVILQLETALAKAQWSRVENRDPVKTFNRIELDKLPALMPDFDWSAYLQAAGVAGKIRYMNIEQPTYFTALGQIFEATPLETWKQYFTWQTLAAYAPFLNSALVDERFAFTGTAVRGTPKNEPQWRLAVNATNLALGHPVGKLYVAKYFPPQDKARMLALVNNLLAAFRDGIDTLDWMGPETKKEAQAKLATFKPYIGYPDKWRDFSALVIKPGDLVGNVRRSREFRYQFDLDKLGKPFDRDQWSMLPQTVNASYSPNRNSITFPAAILQPPFFNTRADDAVNYGAIGAVIGHEISHGFDDEGSQFDGKGNLRDWWTREDRASFEKRADGLVKEYGEFSPVAGYKVNGRLTLGENIGDNSGIAIAFKAYQKSLGGKAAPVIDGFTGEQRFFLGFGQVWRSKTREASLINQIKTDPHTPAEFRGPGAVVNQPAFYEAFGIKPGDKMYLAPEQRVIMW